MLQYSIGLSVILSLLSTELLGLYSGGMISAGYLAFYLEQPLRIATTLLVSLCIYVLTSFLSRFVILTSRRRFSLSIILGLLLGTFVNRFVFMLGVPQDLRLIGSLIPSLIANDMHKQGWFKTILALLLNTLLVRLVLYAGVYL
ncbi:MAG: poly-gamma-glutamate biosynthesis protein PgsC/CapC [Christensenellales bacterium]|jgi:poly-gamma-glutamate biosynthesis protein PgsC/CapC|nr:poly-gamma-glutamate biosynthesis protein PgsC [Clostridiales bacterium]